MSFPKPQKIIDGKLYKLRFRFETKAKAESSAKYQRMVYNSRIGYSIKVVKLSKDQWGMVDWDVKKWATYEYMGFLPKDTHAGMGLDVIFG
jgi:hypothetical protein